MDDKLIIAVDFDGVICEQNIHYVPGKFDVLRPDVVKAIQTLYNDGHSIIIFTCRGDVKEIANFLHEKNIPFDAINENIFKTPTCLNSGKPVADVYIDDKALFFGGSWTEVLRKLSEMFPYDISESSFSEFEKLCPLCRIYQEGEIFGTVYHEDDICIVVDCITCCVPMVVLKRHSISPTQQEQRHMQRILRSLGKGRIDGKRRTIKDHWHAHLR